MKWFSFSSLRARLLLLGFFAAIPAIELIITAYIEQRQLVRDKTRDDALKAAQLVAEDYDDLVEGARQLLITLAQLPEVRTGRANECGALFANLLRQYQRYTNFGAARSNGEVFCSGLPVTRAVALANEPSFQQAIETRQFAVGEYVIGHVSGKPSITFVYPIAGAKGDAQGAVFAGVAVDWLAQLSGKLRLPAGATLTLADRKGKILVQYPGPAHWVGKPIP